MRRLAALAALTGAVTLVPAVGAAAAPAKSPATEVCEPMVRNAIEASLGAPLPGPQQGGWAGRTYTCTYPVSGGQLVLRVDDLRTKAKAKAAYGRLATRAPRRTRLNGLGDAAFQAADGRLVAVKDQFLLSIDPSAVPAPAQRSDLAFAAVVAVMGCWSGAGT
jgi:hypothetical protein